MRRVFVGLAQVFVGLAAQLRNNRLLPERRANFTAGVRNAASACFISQTRGWGGPTISLFHDRTARSSRVRPRHQGIEILENQAAGSLFDLTDVLIVLR